MTRSARFIVIAFAMLLTFIPAIGASSAVVAAPTRTPSGCWWATLSAARTHTPRQLAEQVLRRMTLEEKIAEVGLENAGGYENENGAVPSLCLPPLTLQDGPNGIGTGDTGVTQLPASLAIAASFDTATASAYGRVLGAEARDQGIDVVQGPNLNLARLPNTGRIYEGYGEDPFLTSVMGVADIKGIQSEGVMAEAKHLGAYTEETARVMLNQAVAERTLQELYLAPFKAAVEQAHVAALMCAYGRINEVPTCGDASLFELARRSWGFGGFFRSDMGAVVSQPVAAFNAGLDAIKPAVPYALRMDIRNETLSVNRLDAAVLSILTEMFAYGLIARPHRGRPMTRVWTSGHVSVALRAAEESIVLLKDSSNSLPLDRDQLRSVAVIGEDAGPDALTAGYGGARVVAPFLVTPSRAIRRWLQGHAAVSFTNGGPGGEGLTAVDGSTVPLYSPQRPGPITNEARTARVPAFGPGWESWTTWIAPRTTGLYDFSVRTEGDTWISVDGDTIVADPGLHGPATWSTTDRLVGGRDYRVLVRWFQSVPSALEKTAMPVLRWMDVTPMIERAAAQARHSTVAIVFVSDFNEEGFDRPTLSLPGDSDDLITAVAAANPRTVVVLNTGGAVLMPWLPHVAAVLEAWYPGEEDGNAIVAALSGAIDPSGHLPITFPRSDEASPMSSPASWPGIDGTVALGGLDIGYRYYDERRLSPLFPFGFGLSYTSFALSDLTASPSGEGVRVGVIATNTGRFLGRVVVQAYLSYPKSAGEPPRELKGFASTSLEVDESKTLTISLPFSAFEIFNRGRFTTPTGEFVLSVGTSERNLPLRLPLMPPDGTNG
jgi:beta-glucosidase